MRLKNEGAEIFVPDGTPEEEALRRTTHMSVGAHVDDAEIGAYDGILKCFGSDELWFTSVTATNGSGSPRDGLYAKYTNEEMMAVRKVEQRKVATVGGYAAAVMLYYPSAEVKDANNADPKEEIKAVIELARPQFIYTHNFADKHDTHVATALRTLQALRELPEEAQPEKLYGCEVWRDLDWMADKDKVVFDVGEHENLAAALLGTFDSQVCGGKRYDLATIGRRRANATYHESHGVDVTTAMIFAMDLTPLMQDADKDVWGYVKEHIDRFAEEVSDRLKKLT